MNTALITAYIYADQTLASAVAIRDFSTILGALNAKTVPVLGSVSCNIFRMWCAKNGVRTSIKTHANNISSPLQNVAILLEDMLGDANAVFDFSYQGNVDILNAWITAGELTTVQRDELLALATKNISIAEQQFGQNISISDLWEAFQ